MRRTIVLAVGVIAILLGALFSLQGVGLVGGSFMTGDRLWVLIGVTMIVIGLGLAYNELRTSRRT